MQVRLENSIEKQFSYEGLSMEQSVKHFAKFACDIWQIHPFCEGNTRATAVFMIKYMKSFGFDVNNDAFEHHSWYFRNALVRANYNDLKNNVQEKNYIRRVNGKRYGKWEVLVEISE